MTNAVKTAVLLAAMGGLAMALGQLLGGSGGLMVGLVMGVIMVGGSYFFSDKVAIKSARAVPADPAQFPEYYTIMQELTEKADMPMPKLYISPNPQPNAFATGRNPKHSAVAVTDGMLKAMDWGQIRGVLAHELMHIKNRDILISSVAALIAMVVTYAARMAMWGGRRSRDGGDIIVGIAMALLAPMAAMFIQGAISRTREFQADASAARLMGDGEPLAAALETLAIASGRLQPAAVKSQPPLHYIIDPVGVTQSNFGGRRGGMRQAMPKFSTHPPIEQRIAALRGGDWQDA